MPRPLSGTSRTCNLKRIGLSYFVRLTIPDDRQGDVGRVMGTKSGRREEVVRILRTRDYRTAIRTRDAALDALRGVVNAALAGAGMKPLHDDPDLPTSAPAWLSEAVRDREDPLRRSDERSGTRRLKRCCHQTGRASTATYGAAHKR